jgi:hypothetical protein
MQQVIDTAILFVSFLIFFRLGVYLCEKLFLRPGRIMTTVNILSRLIFAYIFALSLCIFEMVILEVLGVLDSGYFFQINNNFQNSTHGLETILCYDDCITYRCSTTVPNLFIRIRLRSTQQIHRSYNTSHLYLLLDCILEIHSTHGHRTRFFNTRNR